MSVDDRLRSAFSANASTVEADVEVLLSTTFTRYRRGRALRWVGATGLAAAACAALVLALAWHDDPAPPPVPARTATTAPCPRPGDGGTCLGDVAAGTYHTQTFQPGFQYTVPKGWRNDQDLTGNFLLVRQQDNQAVSGGTYLGIYQNVAASSTLCVGAQPGVGQTPQALVAWLRNVPTLVTSTPKGVTVGGLSGYQMDIDVPKGQGTCSVGPGGSPLISGGGVSVLDHVAASDIHVRLIILGWRTGNLTIEITSAKELYPAAPDADGSYTALVSPILNSLRFGP